MRIEVASGWPVQFLLETLQEVESGFRREEIMLLHYTNHEIAQVILKKKEGLLVSQGGYAGGGVFFSKTGPVDSQLLQQHASKNFGDVFKEFKERQLRRNYGDDAANRDDKCDVVLVCAVLKSLVKDISGRDDAVYIPKVYFETFKQRFFPFENIKRAYLLRPQGGQGKEPELSVVETPASALPIVGEGEGKSLRDLMQDLGLGAFFENLQHFRIEDLAAKTDETLDEMAEDAGMSRPNRKKFLQLIAGQRLAVSEREQVRVEAIRRLVQQGLGVLATLRLENAVLRKHQAETQADFTYTVDEQKVEIEATPLRRYVTNCLKCNFTCHDSRCSCANPSDKQHCCAMDSSGHCTVCPNRCCWSLHQNSRHRYVVKTQRVTKTAAELRAGYRMAQERIPVERMQMEEIWKTMFQLLKDTKAGSDSLKLSHLDYIDTLIASEQQAGMEGWQVRVDQLHQVRALAELVQQYAKDQFDPFQGEQASFLATIKAKYQGEVIEFLGS